MTQALRWALLDEFEEYIDATLYHWSIVISYFEGLQRFQKQYDLLALKVKVTVACSTSADYDFCYDTKP